MKSNDFSPTFGIFTHIHFTFISHFHFPSPHLTHIHFSLSLSHFSFSFSYMNIWVYTGAPMDQCNLADVLWTSSTMFSSLDRRVGTKRIFLFTNDDNPNKVISPDSVRYDSSSSFIVQSIFGRENSSARVRSCRIRNRNRTVCCHR